MPAKDRYHDTVVRALQKDGWDVDEEQKFLSISGRRIWIDLMIQREATTRLVEVKGFETRASILEYLAHTLGQMNLYTAYLDYLDNTTPLYLAVPAKARWGILNEAIGRQVVGMYSLHLLVFDPDTEEGISWEA